MNERLREGLNAIYNYASEDVLRNYCTKYQIPFESLLPPYLTQARIAADLMKFVEVTKTEK